MKWNLEQIVEWTSGQQLSVFATEFNFIGTDTRADLSGKVFIALKGDSYDAHDYLDQAVAKNAVLLIVHRLDPKFENLTFQSGDVIVLRGSSALSSLVSNITDTPSSYSHSVMVYIDDNNSRWGIEALVGKGVVLQKLDVCGQMEN